MTAAHYPGDSTAAHTDNPTPDPEEQQSLFFTTHADIGPCPGNEQDGHLTPCRGRLQRVREERPGTYGITILLFWARCSYCGHQEVL